MDKMNSSTAPAQSARCARCGAPIACLGEYYVHRAPSDHAAEPEWPAAPLRSAEADVLAEEVRRLRGRVERLAGAVRALARDAAESYCESPDRTPSAWYEFEVGPVRALLAALSAAEETP